jgi:hypothetical protein
MNASRSLRGFVLLSSLSAYIQEWIRKEIVADDPYDDVSYFPAKQEESLDQLLSSCN